MPAEDPELNDATKVEGTRTTADPFVAAAAQVRELRRQGFSVAVIANRIREERRLTAPEAESVVRRVFREPLSISFATAKARMMVGGFVIVGATVTGAVAYGLSQQLGWFQWLMALGVLLGAVHFIRGFSRLQP